MTAPTRKTSPSLFPLSPPATRSRRYLFHPLLRLRRRNIPRLRWCGRPRLERRLASACEAGRGGPAGGVLVTFRACWSQLGDTEIGSSCRLESTFQPVVPSGQTRLRGPVLPPLLARSTRSSRCVLPCPPPRTGSGPAQLVRAMKLSCATARANPRAGASGRLFGSSGTADWAFALIVTGYKGSRLAFVGWHLPTGGGARPASARPAPPQPGRTRRRPAAGAGPDAAPGGELGRRTANRLDGADSAGPQNSAVCAGPWRRMTWTPASHRR